jgi:hypothetical protein
MTKTSLMQLLASLDDDIEVCYPSSHPNSYLVIDNVEIEEDAEGKFIVLI